MISIIGLLRKWVNVILHPVIFFKKENKAKNLSYGMTSVFIAGVITAIINVSSVGLSEASLLRFQDMFGANFVLFLIIFILAFMPALGIVLWGAMSVVLFWVARALKGRGAFTSQAHAVALVNSAFGVLSAVVLTLVSAATLYAPETGAAGRAAVSVILAAYNLYVLTVALKSVHRYSAANAVLTWLIPASIALVLVVVSGVALVASIIGNFYTLPSFI